MSVRASGRTPAPVTIPLRISGLGDLFDPLEPGPLEGRRIVESSVADYLRDRLAELPDDGDLVVRLTLDAGAAPAADEVEAATGAFRAGWGRVLGDLEQQRSRDRRYGLRYLLGGTVLLIVGFLLGQAGLLAVTDDQGYLIGTAVATVGGVLVISAWVLVWEATAIAVFGHRDHNRQVSFARRLGRATLVVDDRPG